MARVAVVGSGPSGVHFALTALRRGHEVVMIDVGHTPAAPALPDATFPELKERLDDPVKYFLGPRFDSVLLPSDAREYYGIPPSKQYVFAAPPGFDVSSQGFEPLFSFARGGLAEAWTAGCYPFNDHELAEFPFSYADLAPHYTEVARRIGITGMADDLARFMPVHDEMLEPLALDAHSERLWNAYQAQRGALNASGCYVGRTRVATLTRPRESRGACRYTGRCLWGCPVDALYTPSLTLQECLAFPEFRYLTGHRVRLLRLDRSRRATAVVARPNTGGPDVEVPCERVVLAAGSLGSAEIVLRTIDGTGAGAPVLKGLMDNRQVMMPFLNLGMLGRSYRAESYQYHLLGLGLAAPNPAEYVHAQITTLKTALLHPVIQRLPVDLRTAAWITSAVHGALGVVNLNYHDTRRPGNTITLEPGASGAEPRLRIQYAPAADEPARLKSSLRAVRRALWRLGCIVPPGMTHVRPMGASVHYAGLFPMSAQPSEWSTTEECRSRDIENLYLVDGSTFPFLPAKNITFTLMANAVRVAEIAF